MSGKGSKRRPRSLNVSVEEYGDNLDRIFAAARAKRKKEAEAKATRKK